MNTFYEHENIYNIIATQQMDGGMMQQTTKYDGCRKEAEIAYLEGQEQLGVLKRQVVLGDLYPSAKSVMEAA